MKGDDRRYMVERGRRFAKVLNVIRNAYDVADVAANLPAAWKFPTSATETRQTMQHREDLTYGEVYTESIDVWIEAVSPTEEDNVLDAGSGVGKVVLQVAQSTKCNTCVGMEIVASRHKIAKTAHRKLPSDLAKRVEFIEGDFLGAKEMTRIRATTILYTANKVFAAETNRKIIDLINTLPSLRAVVCMVEPCPRHTRLCHKVGKACALFHEKFERVLTAPCEVSWCQGSQLLVYKLRA